MKKVTLTRAEHQALLDVAENTGIRHDYLWKEIDFESSWNPQARNMIRDPVTKKLVPGSSARGLLQFMDVTARRMGFTGSADLILKYPTIEKQLRGPVLDYLRGFMPFRDTLQDLCMAVFWPAARHWPLEGQFPERVRKANPGIITVGDYVERVRLRAHEPEPED